MAESQTIEWKESWRDEYLKWVCGFVNAQGGVLEIGRHDDSKAIGATDARKLMEDLPNKMRDLLGIIADVDLIEEDGHELVRITFPGVQREGTYPLPEEALREGIVNAIAHKDYSSGNPIQISVYDDKIQIWNNGQLPEDWTVDRLFATHPSVPYNPDVASSFFYAGDIEAWGSGIKRMLTSCEKHGSPPPQFAAETIGLMLTFPFRDQAGTMSALSRH